MTASTSARILVFTALAFGFIVINAFSAGLSSALSVKVVDDAVNTVADVAAHGYVMFTQGGTSMQDYFSKANEGSAERELWDTQVKQCFSVHWLAESRFFIHE